jgi:hypothetical protein
MKTAVWRAPSRPNISSFQGICVLYRRGPLPESLCGLKGHESLAQVLAVALAWVYISNGTALKGRQKKRPTALLLPIGQLLGEPSVTIVSRLRKTSQGLQVSQIGQRETTFLFSQRHHVR